MKTAVSRRGCERHRRCLSSCQSSHFGLVGTGGEEFMRVLLNPLYQHLEMQMRTGRTASRSDVGNMLAALDDVADLHQQAGSMGVACDNIIAMVDLEHVAVLMMVL